MYSLYFICDMANILVCDDDKEIVDAIEIYLLQEGYTIFKYRH